MSTRLSDLQQYRQFHGYSNSVIREYKLRFPELLTATVPTDSNPVAYSRYCYGCHAAFGSPEAFDRVWCEECEPEPMTLATAVEVLNSHKYLGRRWVPSDSKAEWADGAISVPRHFDNPAMSPGPTEYFNEFQTIAIAEKLERESK